MGKEDGLTSKIKIKIKSTGKDAKMAAPQKILADRQGGRQTMQRRCKLQLYWLGPAKNLLLISAEDNFIWNLSNNIFFFFLFLGVMTVS